jgi:hypothetical protein
VPVNIKLHSQLGNEPPRTKARINSNESKIVFIYSLLLRSLLPRRRIGTSTTLASASTSTCTSVSMSTPCAKALLSLAVLQLRLL